MRLFCIWNRNYKLAWVIAKDIDAALTLATAKGHLKRPTGYRKWREHDETVTDPVPDLAQGLLDGLTEGVVTTTPPNSDYFIVE